MVKRHSGGSTIVVMRHDGDVGLIWWVSWADLVGLGIDCGPAVRGLIWWVSGSVLVGFGCLYQRCLSDGDDESRWCY